MATLGHLFQKNTYDLNLVISIFCFGNIVTLGRHFQKNPLYDSQPLFFLLPSGKNLVKSSQE
jgi:hypothetical protein